MPKKQAAAASRPPPLSNRDHLERANFALQASLLLQTACPSFAPSAAASSSSSATASTSHHQPQPSSRTKPAHDRKGKRKASASASSHDDTAGPVTSRMGRATMRSFAKWTVHNQVKLDPGVKRAVCRCAAVLVLGLTCKVRVRPSKTHCNALVQTCLSCGAQHRLPAPPQSASTTARLDGPVRAYRRAKKARGAPQHRREQPSEDIEAEAESAAGLQADGTPAEAAGDDDASPKINGGKNNSNNNSSSNGRGGKKGAKKPGKGGGGDSGADAAGDAAAPTGHVLWRGSERVGGWGTLERGASKETTPTPTPTPMPLPYRRQRTKPGRLPVAHANGQRVVHPDAPAASAASAAHAAPPPESTTDCSGS